MDRIKRELKCGSHLSPQAGAKVTLAKCVYVFKMRKSSQQTNLPKIIIPPARGLTPASISDDSEMEAQSAQTDKCRDSSHFTPTKSNALKKLRPHDEDIINATLLQATTSLTARFDSQDEKLEEMANQMRRNSVMIAEIFKAVEFNAAEIKDCKEKCLETRNLLLGLTSSHKDQASRTSELERYKKKMESLDQRYNREA
ncbi:cytoplasmic dynein 2 heavy chain 1-like protein [Labeo rohita]|uniref:Cytoplasmic dynein 2 heavy chain 1-like protein n=1 Tax=Labeo rohita TaxID=84645 RepID=A0A498MF56_LABRO|nr:cytoplasmic dynein 2 heavy chain 1-like protein [Labeo rohita]